MVKEELADVLSEFPRTMVTDCPIQRILDHLVELIVNVMPVTGAGVTLISATLEPQHIAASDASSMGYEKLQTELGEGPCLAAYQTGEAISVPASPRCGMLSIRPRLESTAVSMRTLRTVTHRRSCRLRPPTDESPRRSWSAGRSADRAAYAVDERTWTQSFRSGVRVDCGGRMRCPLSGNARMVPFSQFGPDSRPLSTRRWACWPWSSTPARERCDAARYAPTASRAETLAGKWAQFVLRVFSQRNRVPRTGLGIVGLGLRDAWQAHGDCLCSLTALFRIDGLRGGTHVVVSRSGRAMSLAGSPASGARVSHRDVRGAPNWVVGGGGRVALGAPGR